MWVNTSPSVALKLKKLLLVMSLNVTGPEA